MEHTEIGPYGSRWVASSSVANRGAVFWTSVIGPPLVVVAVVVAAAGIRTFESSLSWVQKFAAHIASAAQRMGGTLGVISELGQGSRFWFELERGTA